LNRFLDQDEIDLAKNFFLKSASFKKIEKIDQELIKEMSKFI